MMNHIEKLNGEEEEEIRKCPVDLNKAKEIYSTRAQKLKLSHERKAQL